MPRFAACRRGSIWVSAVVIIVLAAPVVADAARPLPGKRYSGTGVERLNNGPHWMSFRSLPREGFHFSVAPQGKAVLTFRGRFYFYCGSGTDTVRAARIAVGAKGAFSYHFSVPTREANGTISGRTYVSIAGSFANRGKVAHVSYIVVFGKVHPAHDPYTAAGAYRDGCGSWVTGTATAN
jgi:hypothetical protein